MSALKGLKVSPTSTVACSLCIRKKKSSPCGPYFPGTFHSMDAVCRHTHDPSGPSEADRFLPQTLEEANARHCETPFHQALGPKLLIRIFHTHSRALSSATIGSLRYSSHKVLMLFRFFLRCCLYAWCRSIHCSPAPLVSFIFQKAFAFWASCGFFTPTALLISL